MKTETYPIVIDNISAVSGGWNDGFSVDVDFHRVINGQRDGFETRRVSLDRDRLIKADGSHDLDAVAAMVQEAIGDTETVEIE